MTNDSYQQFLQNSELFQRLPQETQAALRDAPADKRERYMKALEDSDRFLDGAKRDMVEQNEKALKNFQIEMKTLRKEKRVTDEARATQHDEAASEKLLKELDDV